MTLFPKPVKPPPSVSHARKKRQIETTLSTSVGIAIRLSIIGIELAGFYLFGSAALLLDAMSTALDVLGSILLIFSIWYAERPPDKNHPFGHGRLEPLIGLQLSLLLVGVGGYMLYQQFFLIYTPPYASLSPFVWIFPFISLILLEMTYQVIKRSAQKHDSAALNAEAIHYRIDGITSLVATIVLVIGSFFPELSHRLDHFGALLIAAIMVVIGIQAAGKNINQLLDKIPPQKYFKLVKQSAESIDGVLGTEKIRIQQYGPDAHVDIDIEVEPSLTVDLAHKISQKVRAEIQKRWPSVRDVIVHIEPYYPNDH